MTDTTDAQAPATPDWLTKAEAAYRKEQRLKACHRELSAQRINKALADLGISPARPAYGNADAVRPALIIEPDHVEELYGVEAEWDNDLNCVRLFAIDYCKASKGGFGRRRVELLREPKDVVKVRHRGPVNGRPHDPTHSLYRTALGGVDFRPHSESSPDSDQVCQQLAALTAAVLHLADTVTRGLSRS